MTADYALGSTIDHFFTTRAFATGVPTTLTGIPDIAVYEDNSTTEISSGLTLNTDFDSRQGLNHIRIVATSGNGFESGKSYCVVLIDGTVGGVDVSNEVVWHFTLDRQSLRPTTAGNTLDVNATGEAGIDLDNTSGTLAAAQIADNAITAAKIAANAITDAKIATDAITSAKIAANAIGSSELASNAIGAAQIATDAITNAKIAAGAITSSEAPNLDAAVSSRSSHSAADVWAVATRVLTANTNFNDPTTTQIRDAILPEQNTAFSNIVFTLVQYDANGKPVPVTGATGLFAERSIDGGAFGTGTGTIAEISDGAYQYDASAADMNGGKITFRFGGTGGTPGAPDDTFVTVVTGTGV